MVSCGMHWIDRDVFYNGLRRYIIFFANLCEIEPEKMYVEAKKKIAIYFLANFFGVEVWLFGWGGVNLVEDFHTIYRVKMNKMLPYEIGHSLGVLLTYWGENTQPKWLGVNYWKTYRIT